MSVFQVTIQQLKQMVKHAQKEVGYEVCGLIGGHWQPYDKLAIATQVNKVSNIAGNRRNQYRMDEQEQVRLMSAYSKMGLELVGIYHSHPHGPAIPSPTDIAEASYPDAVYVILAPRSLHSNEQHSYSLSLIESGYEISTWRLQHGEATAVKIEVVERE